MRELSAPLRMTWDLPADPEAAAEMWRRIVSARLLFVEVRVTENSLNGLTALAAGVTEGLGPRISVLGEPEALRAAWEGLGPQALSGADLLMLPAYTPLPEVQALASGTHRLVPSLWSTPEGLTRFAEALDLARTYRFGTVAVLNPPAPAVPLGPDDRQAAARLWESCKEDGLQLRVHDLFLADSLGLDPFRSYEGCQGGSTSAHLTEHGRVLACRTFPVALGNLLEQSLSSIWASRARRALRTRLGRAPEGCEHCSLVASCAGGCRGLALNMGRDPSCTGPRLLGSGQGGDS